MFSGHTTPEEFENGGFTLKCSNVFRPHYARGIWKRRFHSEMLKSLRPHYAGGIWKRRLHSEMLKSFTSTLRRRNLKTEASLWNAQMFSSHTTPEEFENGGFTLKCSNVLRPHCARGIWKRRLHSEMLKSFTSTLRQRNLKTEVSFWNAQMFYVHTTPEEFENGGFTLKCSNVLRPHYARGIWKRRFHSEMLKCFTSTLRQRNLKTEVSLWNAQMFYVHTTPEEFENGGFTLKCSNVFRPHYAGGIWKRRFYAENAQMFYVHTTPEEFRTQQSPVILDLCLVRNWSG